MVLKAVLMPDHHTRKHAGSDTAQLKETESTGMKNQQVPVYIILQPRRNGSQFKSGTVYAQAAKNPLLEPE